MKLSVSILSSSINAADIVKQLDNTLADYIHVDIMDGFYVDKTKNICNCFDDDFNLIKKILIIFINFCFLFILFFIFDITIRCSFNG